MDAFKLVMLICLAFVSIVGGLLNGLTLYLLARNKTLAKKLTTVRWLMFGESAAELLVCVVGAPLTFINLLLGDSYFMLTNSDVMCNVSVLAGFDAGYVAIWYQTIIALTRLAAIFAPQWYGQYSNRAFTKALLISSPWFVGYVVYACGAAAGSFYTRRFTGSGSCGENKYDDTPEAAARFSVYVLSDSIIHTWIPLLLGLLCYAIIFGHKLVQRCTPESEKETTPTKDLRSQIASSKLRILSIAAPSDAAVVDNKNEQQLHVSTAMRQTSEALHRSRLHRERENKLRLLAITYVVNFCLIFPNGVVWGLDWFAYLVENLPVLSTVLEVMTYLAFPVNPVLYVLISGDFRQAVRELFRRQ